MRHCRFLKKNAEDAQSFAQIEFTKIAQTIVSIQEMLVAGQINQQQATQLLDMQKSASRSVLLTVRRTGSAGGRGAINVALNVIKRVVNTAVKFPMIP